VVARSESAGSTLEATTIEGLSRSPLSAALSSGELIFTSGQTGRELATGKVPESFEDQVHMALRNLDLVLQAAGGSLSSVAKTTVYLVSPSDFPAMNAIYAQYFDKPHPARSTVIVAALAAPDLKFEIEAIAVRGNRAR
jgi:2-iminobutanoate/2-iminopropanoate deaminase